jgi:hypothetical protein
MNNSPSLRKKRNKTKEKMEKDLENYQLLGVKRWRVLVRDRGKSKDIVSVL